MNTKCRGIELRVAYLWIIYFLFRRNIYIYIIYTYYIYNLYMYLSNIYIYIWVIGGKINENCNKGQMQQSY